MWIKICGIRDVETAVATAQTGADAIGLNFYDKSPRVIAVSTAAEIVSHLPDSVTAVGVFVNHSIDKVRAICRECNLTTIQLHGDEPPEQVAALSREYRVIRAFRAGDEGLEGLIQEFEAYQRLGAILWACLIDARVEGSFGGTGQTAPWELLKREYKTAEWPRLILAGGLRPDEVADAIRTVRPWGVDVAGGVESSVACKDAALVREFVVNARAARGP